MRGARTLSENHWVVLYAGGGTYEIKDDGVDVDINLKIARKQPKPSGGTPGGGGTPVSPVPPAKPQTVAPALCPVPCPAGVKPGQVVTPKPANPAAGAQVTPAPKPGSPPSSPGASPTPAAATLGPVGATQTPQTTTAAPAATTTAPAGGAPIPTLAPAGGGGKLGRAVVCIVPCFLEFVREHIDICLAICSTAICQITWLLWTLEPKLCVVFQIAR